MTKETFLELDLESAMIIDIRERNEISISTAIKNAINIPMLELAREIESGALDKQKKIVTICQSGGRCIALHTLLSTNGYEADYLEGGILALG